MAVVPMQKVTLLGLQRDRKKLLELIQRRGVVEVSAEAEAPPGYTRTDSGKMLAHLDRCSRTVDQALDILQQYVPEKKSMLSSLEGPRQMTEAEYKQEVDTHEESIAAARRLTALARKVAECEGETVRIRTQLDSLKPWLELDVSMKLTGTRQTTAFIGTIPEALTLSELLGRLAAQAPEAEAVHAEIISTSTDQTAVFVLCIQSQRQMVGDALRAIGFSLPAVSAGTVPEEESRRLQEKQAAVQQEKADAEQEIRNLAPMRKRIEFLVDYYASRRVKYEAIDRMLHTKNVFVLEGYIPQPAIEDLKKAVERFEVWLEFETPPEGEQPPVLLKNSAFTEPAEGVVEMYSMPSVRDIDPTSIMSVFYYILFGMMLSDAAYGLLMAVGCFVLVKKFPRMKAGLKKSLKMFMWCGVSTFIWGALFGSWFGDAPQIIASVFFGVEFTVPALWFTPLDDPMRLLMFSFVLGIIHLYVGLGIQFYQLWKAGQKADAIYDVGAWYGLVTGLLVWLCSTELFQGIAGLSFTIPEVIVLIAQLLSAASALLIIFTAGRTSRKPVIRFLKGLYGLYNVTSYLSDILSYSRLLALGLATGVIASVINQMGSMMGPSVGGVILFIVVFLIGHVFNIGINLLGAYVHTNRLQYVEFFGKFYEGGGEKFKPFARTAKFIQFKEEK